jgi:hypothetical protein
MIGGPPKPPERHQSQEIQDFIMYVGALPLTEEEKRLLMSIVAEKQLGQLTVFVNKVVSRQVTVDPSKTDAELTAELSTVFDAIFEEVFHKTDKDSLTEEWDPEMKMNIVFLPIKPNQLQ